MHKIIFGLGLLILLVNISCTTKPTIDDKFNGTYKLDKFESYDSVSWKMESR